MTQASDDECERHHDDEHQNQRTHQMHLAARGDPLRERAPAKDTLASDSDEVGGERDGGGKPGDAHPDRSTRLRKVLHQEQDAVGHYRQRGSSPRQSRTFGLKAPIERGATYDVDHPAIAV